MASKKMISLEIPDSLREALRIRAFKENVSVSEIIRRILSDNLSNNDVNNVGEVANESMITTRDTRA